MKIVRFGVYSTTTRELLHTFDVDDDGKITNPRAFDEEVWLLPVVKYDGGTQFGKYIHVRKGDQLESFRDGILGGRKVPVESDDVQHIPVPGWMADVPTDASADLIRDLREIGPEYYNESYTVFSACLRAANRIEHLEAALRDIEAANFNESWSEPLEGCVRIAREALAGEYVPWDAST